MSAFLCSDLHTAVAALLTAKLRNPAPSVEDVRAIAGDYRTLNNRALRARYRAAPEELVWSLSLLDEASAWVEENPPLEHYSVLACLLYQCSEGDCHEHPTYDTMSWAKGKYANSAGTQSVNSARTWGI